MPPFLQVDGVTKVYGRDAAAAHVLRGIDLEVCRAELLSIMGPSGCGKTTLMNLLAGLDAPTAGRVVIDGRRVDRMDEAQRSALRLSTIGLVFQNFNLLPRLSVERNVTWRLELAGSSSRAARRDAAELLDRVGIPAAAWGRPPAKLSGGEQQRVAIARALATGPSLLLADEPTGNLDSTTGESILALFRDLNRERRMTIVMVTHDARAAHATDRIVELRDGVVRRDFVPRRDDRRERGPSPLRAAAS